MTKRTCQNLQHFSWALHTAVTLLRAMGVELADPKDLLGHSGVGVTADFYRHVTEGVLRRAVTRWEDVLAGQG